MCVASLFSCPFCKPYICFFRICGCIDFGLVNNAGCLLQFLLSGHVSCSRQLHLGDLGATLHVTFLLWFLIIFAMLSVQL